MKIWFLLAFALLMHVAAQAQSAAGKATINGVVTDSLKNEPVAFVTVSLRESGKTEVLKSTYTQENGRFAFTGLEPKPYQLLISYVGFQPRTIKAEGLSITNLNLKLPAIKLQAGVSQLKEVEVTTQKLLITQDIDKISYDVEADPESKTETVLDMLRKVPMVTVDADDNIQLKGSGSYKVLINGKTSALFVRDPKEVFRTMPASTIKKIEVITNPPAKYEAEGVGGIINIITNQKSPGGYNGSVSAGLRAPFAYNGSAYLTVKTGKFGFSGSFGTNSWQQPNSTSSLVRQETNGQQLNQSGNGHNEGNNRYGSAQLSFELDSLNLFTGNMSWYKGTNDISSNQHVLLDSAGIPLQQYRQLRESLDDWDGYDVGLDYQRNFRRHAEQLLTLSYRYNTNGYGTFSDFSYHPELNYIAKTGRTDNSNNESEHTMQVDYVQPFGKNTLEIGAKSISRLNQSTYYYALLNEASGQYDKIPSQSNDFDYNQDIYAGYTSVSLKKGLWGLKVGGRLEETKVNATFITTETGVQQDYLNFIPSIALSRTLKEMQDLKLSYTQRIERPGLWFLNPYVNRVDPYNVSFGNPKLVAAKSHSFDLSHSAIIKTSSLNSSLYYNFVNNAIQEVTALRNDTSYTTFGNIGKEQNLSLNVNANLNLTKKLNLNLNSSVSYVMLTGSLNGQTAENDGLSGSLFGYASYKTDKKWRFGGNGGFNSRQVMLQGRSGGYFHTSFSVSRSFLKNDKATITANVNNPFQKTRSWINEVNGTNFYQRQESEFLIRRFGISFSYKFGELQGGIAQKKRGIENNDVKGGKSGGGG